MWHFSVAAEVVKDYQADSDDNACVRNVEDRPEWEFYEIYHISQDYSVMQVSKGSSKNHTNGIGYAVLFGKP